MRSGDIVIVNTGQAGTLQWEVQGQAQVLLANGDMWTGTAGQVRPPQEGEIEHAPRDVDRFDPRTMAKRRS